MLFLFMLLPYFAGGQGFYGAAEYEARNVKPFALRRLEPRLRFPWYPTPEQRRLIDENEVKRHFDKFQLSEDKLELDGLGKIESKLPAALYNHRVKSFSVTDDQWQNDKNAKLAFAYVGPRHRG